MFKMKLNFLELLWSSIQRILFSGFNEYKSPNKLTKCVCPHSEFRSSEFEPLNRVRTLFKLLFQLGCSAHWPLKFICFH